MKLRVFGFTWSQKDLASAVAIMDVFDKIENENGCETETAMVAVTDIKDWKAGIYLKIRDSKAFTKLRRENGSVTVSAETLEDNEKLVEANFFIAHKSNGAGLFSHHHQSASLSNDFGAYLGRKYRSVLIDKKNKQLKELEIKTKDRKAFNKQFQGGLYLEQAVKAGSFEDRVKQLKYIKQFEGRITGLLIKQPLFQRLFTQASRRKFTLSFDKNAPVSVIANAICGSVDHLEKASVYGMDEQEQIQTYKLFKDTEVFAEYDYDAQIRNLNIDFKDLAASIKASDVINLLIENGEKLRTRKFLGIK